MDGAQFERSTFILHVGKGAGGGGMEHANSTAIGVYSDEYLPSVAAHEFFHLWNVKRIRPISLDPVDDTKEQYTRALWFAEGVTNTYGSYTLVRSGIWSKEQFYADLGEQITELEGRPANPWQGTEPFPYQKFLTMAGLSLRTVEHRRPALGFFMEHEPNGPFVVSRVDSENQAARAGLRAGDIVLTWNGGEVPRRVDRWLQEQKPGDVLKLRIRREDKEMALEFRLGEINETLYVVTEDSHAGEKARHIREGMLRGETSAVTARR